MQAAALQLLIVLDARVALSSKRQAHSGYLFYRAE